MLQVPAGRGERRSQAALGTEGAARPQSAQGSLAGAQTEEGSAASEAAHEDTLLDTESQEFTLVVKNTFLVAELQARPTLRLRRVQSGPGRVKAGDADYALPVTRAWTWC